jgi:hypothetical protein
VRWTFFLLLAACGPVAKEGIDTSHGVNQTLIENCLGCHAGAMGTSWGAGSSHRLLLDCAACHAEVSAKPGPKHRAIADCATCHSVTTHQGKLCRACHDVHGSQNLFLLRPFIDGYSVRLTTPEGLATGSGSGPCEVCHAATKYFPASGRGAPHPTTWCFECHEHELGFRPRP